MTKLPGDIIYQILLHLRVETLCKLQCTSQEWRDIISSTPFQRDHYLHSSKQNPLLLVTHNEIVSGGDDKIHFSTYTEQGTQVNKFFNIVSKSSGSQSSLFPMQSCLGLVCRATTMGEVLICNPSTQKIISLPTPPSRGYNYCIGLGWAESTMEFKVVRIFNCDAAKIINRCQVYTLGTNGKWREARSAPPQYFLGRGCGIFFHRSLHLQPSRQRVDDGIVSFDIETEQFRGIPLPNASRSKKYVSWHSREYLTELRGSLCLIFNFEKTINEMDIWLLKDYNIGNWVKEDSIDLNLLNIDIPYTGPLVSLEDRSRRTVSKRNPDILEERSRRIVLARNALENCYNRRWLYFIDLNYYRAFYVDSFWSPGN